MFYTHGCIFYDPNPHNSSLEITIRRLIFSKSPFKSVLWVKTHTFWRHDRVSELSRLFFEIDHILTSVGVESTVSEYIRGTLDL